MCSVSSLRLMRMGLGPRFSYKEIQCSHNLYLSLFVWEYLYLFWVGPVLLCSASARGTWHPAKPTAVSVLGREGMWSFTCSTEGV